MEYIPNQPVFFNQDAAYFTTLAECSGDEVVYNQLVDNSDVTQFQLSIAPCPDAEQLIANSDFATATDWTLDANWAFGTNQVCATDATTYIDCDTTFTVGYYKFTIVVDSINGANLVISLDGTDLITIDTAGTYNFYGTGTGSGYLRFTPSAAINCCISSVTAYTINQEVEIKVFDEFEHEITSINNVTNPEYFTFEQDRVTVDINWGALEVADKCVYLMAINPCSGAQLISNMFKLGGYASQCTVLINACNNSDSLGFVFGTFSPRIRLSARLKKAKYVNEKNVYEYSDGKKTAYYFSRRKQKSLAVDLQPEYVHDFLSLLAGMDNVYIDNVAYFVDDDEYNVIYNDTLNNFGIVTLQVSEKTQNVKNTLCSGSENSCNLAV